MRRLVAAISVGLIGWVNPMVGFNTVQYSGINTSLSSQNYGEVTSAAAMRALQVQARYRF